MGRWEKLLEQARNNPKGVRFEDACSLAEHFGFTARGGGGSHRVFKRPGYPRLLNFQRRDGMAKEYQVRQLIDAIDELTERFGRLHERPATVAEGGPLWSAGGAVHKYSYMVAWSDADGEYVATSAEFPGLSALGASADDAVRALRDAMKDAVRAYAEDGEPIPEPRVVESFSGQFRLRLPKSLHAALAARAEAEGVSLNALAQAYIAAGLAEDRVAARGETGKGRRQRARRLLDAEYQIAEQDVSAAMGVKGLQALESESDMLDAASRASRRSPRKGVRHPGKRTPRRAAG